MPADVLSEPAELAPGGICDLCCRLLSWQRTPVTTCSMCLVSRFIRKSCVTMSVLGMCRWGDQAHDLHLNSGLAEELASRPELLLSSYRTCMKHPSCIKHCSPIWTFNPYPMLVLTIPARGMVSGVDPEAGSAAGLPASDSAAASIGVPSAAPGGLGGCTEGEDPPAGIFLVPPVVMKLMSTSRSPSSELCARLMAVTTLGVRAQARGAWALS